MSDVDPRDVNPQDSLIAAIPVDEEQQARLRTLSQYLEIPAVQVYEGSVEGSCLACQQAVWLGPKSQETLKLHPDIPVICFTCIIEAGKHGDAPRGVQSLGNTQFDHLPGRKGSPKR